MDGENMELMYPLVIKIGIPVLILAVAVLHVVPARSKKPFSGGVRTGAASIVKSLPIYAKLYKRSRILAFINEFFVIAAIIASLFLIARPFKVQTIKTGVQKRDIFLCMDVSYSLYELNYELTDYLEQVVSELKGDRFGITIFNTSSVVYVPMTDDYDYVVMRLEELKEYFSLQKEYYNMVGDSDYVYFDSQEEEDRYYEICALLDYYEAGTLVNNTYRGSSLIGEGLGSCLYSFPSIGDSSRTRCIIFATDNANSSFVKEIPDLKEASELCAKNEVTVFAIFPSEDAHYYMYNDSDYEGFENELRNAVEVTGGELYVQSQQDTVSEIVEEIRDHEAMTVDDIVTEQKTDMPVPAIIALLICLAGSVISMTVLKGK